MNDIKVFRHRDFGDIRAVMRDGDPWFVGKDLAVALGYSNPRDALARHVDDEDKSSVVIHDGTSPLGGNPNMTVINESGMYSLIFSSKLEGARTFKRWVTSVVLPSIRKSGMFYMGTPLPEFCAMLRTRRIALGLTQKQLADLCGVSRSQYGQWETDRTPNRENMKMLERVLQLEEERQAQAIANAVREEPEEETDSTSEDTPATDYSVVAKMDVLCQGMMKDLQAFKCRTTSEMKARLSLLTKMGALVKLATLH